MIRRWNFCCTYPNVSLSMIDTLSLCPSWDTRQTGAAYNSADVHAREIEPGVCAYTGSDPGHGRMRCCPCTLYVEASTPLGHLNGSDSLTRRAHPSRTPARSECLRACMNVFIRSWSHLIVTITSLSWRAHSSQAELIQVLSCTPSLPPALLRSSAVSGRLSLRRRIRKKYLLF